LKHHHGESLKTRIKFLICTGKNPVLPDKMAVKRRERERERERPKPVMGLELGSQSEKSKLDLRGLECLISGSLWISFSLYDKCD
jgi:hypothetical protein